MRSKEPSIAKITCPGAVGIFPRKRLFRLLDKGRVFPIIWVTGPPGSGKTALVASYLDARKLPCLWDQIDERDADLATFFYYMGMAAKKTAPRKRKPLPLLTSEYLAGIPAFTRRYFEDLYGRLTPPSPSFRKKKEGFAIVLDNYQNVPVHSQFHEMIIQGLDVIPEGINVFILSRNEPPLQLARLLASNKIGFLGGDEIRFTPEETGKLLRAKGQWKLTDDLLLELHKKVGGWAAGLVLILLSSRLGTMDYPSLIRFPTKEIFDYFAFEIFERIEKGTQDFLLRTAFFPRMTAQMAEKLTGISHSKQILSDLNENQYFTEKYAHKNPVYQYYPLFREFLLSRGEDLFGPSEISLIRRNTALILEESGRVEEAAGLFRDAKDWNSLVRLISSQAQSLISQGRNKTLEEWIVSIPENIREKRPWLLYWLGLCKQPFNPAESRLFFEQAFEGLEKQEDDVGTLMAWSGLVDTIIFEWSDFTLLDRWIEWLDRRLQRNACFPSALIEAHVTSSMAGSLLYRQPYHPDIRKWMERALSACRKTEDVNLHLQASLHVVNYYAWKGDLANCSMVADEIRRMAQSQTASTLLVLTWKWMEALIYNRTTESSEMALKSISEGLEIAHKNGVHLWDQMLFSQGVYASFNKKDMAKAFEFLKKMEMSVEKDQRHSLCQFHLLAAWYHLLTGDISRASLDAEMASRFAEETGMHFTRIQCTLLMAQVLSEKGEHKKASAQLSSAEDLIRKSGSPLLEYMCLIKEAQFALGRGGEGKELKRGMEALRKSMQLGKAHGYINLFPWWQPSAMARLCVKALAAGIEVDYVQNLIRKHRLMPDEPPLDVESWPWPLKIHTLGKFELSKEDKPLQLSRKVQKKPLRMLKALIAQGGKGIKEEKLADWLWPEADGDAAHASFKMTLSRLRHLIGDENVIVFHEGRAALDLRYCWVDAWAFERICREVEDLLKPNHSKESMGEPSRLTDRAMELYQGHFLADEEEEFWSASYRERLRNRFLRLLIGLGERLEQREQWEKAAEYYQKALEIDPLAEEFYQHLMVCYKTLARRRRPFPCTDVAKIHFLRLLG